MHPDESLQAFERLLAVQKLDSRLVNASDVLEVTLAFYLGQRAEGCDVGNDGDMMLFQWGTYGANDSKTFQLDLTRQFMVGQGGDDDISQLSFTLHYSLSEETQIIKAGSHWCANPGAVEEFRSFVRSTDAFRLAANRVPSKTEITYSPAG